MTILSSFIDFEKLNLIKTNRHALPHGSYLINIANLDPEKNKQAYGAFLEELKRCEQLGIGNYNFQYACSSERIFHSDDN